MSRRAYSPLFAGSFGLRAHTGRASESIHSLVAVPTVNTMDKGIDVYCSTCFAMAGEPCRTKFIVHGYDEVTPVMCRTHSARLVDSQRESNRHLFAKLLCAVALTTLRGTQTLG